MQILLPDAHTFQGLPEGFFFFFIVNELRLSFVTIVTESAFFVTSTVTESGGISKSHHLRHLNISGRKEN